MTRVTLYLKIGLAINIILWHLFDWFLCSIENDFVTWKEKFWPAVLEHYGIDVSSLTYVAILHLSLLSFICTFQFPFLFLFPFLFYLLSFLSLPTSVCLLVCLCLPSFLFFFVHLTSSFVSMLLIIFSLFSSTHLFFLIFLHSFPMFHHSFLFFQGSSVCLLAFPLLQHNSCFLPYLFSCFFSRLTCCFFFLFPLQFINVRLSKSLIRQYDLVVHTDMPQDKVFSGEMARLHSLHLQKPWVSRANYKTECLLCTTVLDLKLW